MCSSLATFRFDKLFDYGAELVDKRAGALIKLHYYRLAWSVEAQLKLRNKIRFARGQLTFPYLLPSWLPNGVQT